MKEKGTVWVPTLVTTGNLLGCGRYPQEELEKIFDSARANVSCAWERACCLQPEAMPEPTRVLHGQGLVDEYQIFCDLFGETEELKNRLKEGESGDPPEISGGKVWKLTQNLPLLTQQVRHEGGKYDSTEIDRQLEKMKIRVFRSCKDGIHTNVFTETICAFLNTRGGTLLLGSR